MENQVQVITADALEVLNRSEIDVQIATAKRYPRNVNYALTRIQQLATLDEDTAADCFYALQRDSKNGSTSIIEGLSVRMAEIIVNNWGNIRAQARIIGNDGKTITAQGVCHDLETNVAVSVEVKRSILTSKGYQMSESMQVTIGQAACAIAFRNAVLKVVPKAVTNTVVKNIKAVAAGAVNADLLNRRTQMISWFKSKNVLKADVLRYLGVEKEEDITADMIMTLRGLANAINEGTTSINDAFIAPKEAQAKAQEAQAKATGAQERIQKSQAQQN